MGASIVPEAEANQDPLATYRRSKSQDPLEAYRASKRRGADNPGDIDLPGAATDDASTKRESALPYLTAEFAAIRPTPLKLLVRPLPDTRTELAALPVAADAARVKADPAGTGHLTGQGENLPNAIAESAMETITHPVRTAIEIAATPARAGYALGKYRRGEGSGRDAAIGALQTAVMLGAGPVEKLIEPAVARVLGETAGPIATRAALGAGGGAAFSPDRPAVGATLGALIGGASGAKVADETVPEGRKRLISPTQKAVAEHLTEEREAPALPYETADAIVDRGLAPDEVEYRHSGPGIAPATRKRVADVVGSMLHSPATAIRESHPDLTAAGEAALSAPANARHIGQVQTRWVTEGFKPEEAQAFYDQLVLDRITHEIENNPAIARDPAVLRNLNYYQSQIPRGFSESPAFKTMAERHSKIILAQTENAAAAAGLKPEQFASLPNGYVRLVGSKEGAPFAQSVGGTGPAPLTGTRLTTAQKATAAGDYTSSYAEAVTADALDKIVKARRNEFYQQLLKDGQVMENPRATAPEGTVKRSFDDRGNVISDPSEARITLALPPDVAMYADHVSKELNPARPTTRAGVAAKSISRASGGLALLANPAAATSHSLTLASTLGTVPEVGKPLTNLVGVVPGGATIKGAFDIAAVDRTDLATRSLESRLSRIGALRPEMDHPKAGFGKQLEDMRKALGPAGKLLSPHEILFGEDGIDKRSRIVLAQKYIKAAEARGIPVTDSGLRKFVVEHAGDYIRGNAGALVNHLQDSNLSLFARMGVTRVTNAAKSAVGHSGLPTRTVGERAADVAGTLTRGLAGYGVGLTALNYLLSGHSPLSNEPGHMGDLEYTTDERGNKHYIRGAVLNPLASTALRAGGESAIRGDALGVARDALNTAAGVVVSHPGTRAVLEAATGRQPYYGRDGAAIRTVPPELEGSDAVKARVLAGARDMTAAGKFIGDAGPEKNPGVPAGKLLSYLAPPVTSVAKPDGESRTAIRDTNDWLSDRTSQIYRAAGDPEKQQKIIDQSLEDVEKFNEGNHGLRITRGMVAKQLRRAAAKANSESHRPSRLVRPLP